MNNAVLKMLQRYKLVTSEQYKNALKEIIQEIVLLGLSRAKFFEYAAFYGGSALRIIYGIDRFSEDIDFSLLKPNHSFDIQPYCKFVQEELESYGFTVSVEKKKKNKELKVESAFVKANTLQHLIQIDNIANPKSGTHAGKLLKVKFEIDISPPEGASYEVKFCNYPIPFSVKLYDTASLFAGKIHAFLFRDYKGGRIKGRDIYDFIWLGLQHTPLNMHHLEMRMRQSGNWKKKSELTSSGLRSIIKQRAATINFDAARTDVIHFLKRPESINEWSPELILHAYDSIPVS